MKSYLSLITLVVIFGIQLWSPVVARPTEVRADEIGGCTFLGKVTGSSGYGKNPNWEPIAKTYAVLKAEKLGASHLVIVSKHQIGVFNGEVILDAYDCHAKGD
jgi:hypothetical protein